ncbi:FAD-binding oxidoreductase [Rhodococcoides kyotonense]|uniref:FAD/FMN-containing dehydrogenase n=1 Tax=Rhodococcoides kyotonense TaxID=398843 RepID=A0A239KHB3_9NOCA|nr:FAD-binding oxidoreductase [Rhodococcus kyotonensis]SNT17561.1 FAD/FMN-containing dehydrogenase [Rhodococcus kyotonensis]
MDFDSEFDAALDAAAPGRILRDVDAMARYSTDWTGRWTGSPRAVARPRTVEQVAAILAACTEHRVAVVAQGGNTGLVGGAVPPSGSIVLSTEALTATGPVRENGSVTVGAGVTLHDLERLAQENGMTAGLALASGASATVGGVAATNAGGARVLRYGTARDRISGVRAVLAHGDVIDRRSALRKDNTGYDLTDLVVGSEGTLAVITDVTWKLVAPHSDRVVLAMSFTDAQAATDALTTLLSLPGLDALEWAEGSAVERAAAQLDTTPPLPSDGFWVFAELGDSHVGGGSLVDVAEPVIESLSASGLSENRIAVAASAADRRTLWSFRERITESISAAGIPVKLDVGVPAAEFRAFVESLSSVVHAVEPSAIPVLFGHFAESNIHVNILPAEGTFPEPVAEALEDAVLEHVLSAGGTVSAEHGIGRVKTRWLNRQRGDVQVRAMDALKSAWDPNRILNPGVLFDDR